VERARDHAGAGRDVEDEVARLRVHGRDERAPPARILAEREDRGDAVVRPGDAGEDARRVGGGRSRPPSLGPRR
jgi:hypothetical protein